MRVIDVISWFSCSETLIYIIKFQFQPNLRWSNFWLYYCEIQTSNGFSALVFWDMKILKPVLCLFMNLEAMLEPAESSEKVTKIQPPYCFMELYIHLFLFLCCNSESHFKKKRQHFDILLWILINEWYS